MKKSIFLVIALLLSTSSSPALAEIKTFIKEYTYQASEDDSRNSSRTLAMHEVKRLLLEELGIYLESKTEIKNFQLTKDQITTLTAGIVRTEIVDEKWDGHTYWLKSKLVADPNEVVNSIDVLRKDHVRTRELENLRKQSDKIIKENAKLREELTKAKGNKRKKAITAYQNTIKELSAYEWIQVGYTFQSIGSYNDEIAAYNKAIELSPKYTGAYLVRGIAYGKLGNYNKSIEDFDMVIELMPDIEETYFSYYCRGLAYGYLGNYKMALEDYGRAIKKNPKYEQAYVNRGAIYDDHGLYKQAIEDYNKAIEINPKYAKAFYNRGLAYGKLQNFSQAWVDIKVAAKLGYKGAQEMLISNGMSW